MLMKYSHDDRPGVQVHCPKLNRLIIVSTCANCEHRGEIDFANEQVECFYPAGSTPDPPEAIQDGTRQLLITRGIKGQPQVKCPINIANDVYYCVKFCLHFQRWTSSHVHCRWPQRARETTPYLEDNLIQKGGADRDTEKGPQ